MSIRAVPLAAVLLLLAAVTNADLNITKYYDQCLCWNTTLDEFCASSNVDHQEACDHLFGNPMWYWAPFVALLAVIFLFFPFVFAAGRCCNCCGGRHPSYGCCCPDSQLGRRTYTPATQLTVKVSAAVLFLLLLGLVPWSIVTHASLGSSLDRLSDELLNSTQLVRTVRNDLESSKQALSAIIAVPNVILSANMESFLDEAASSTHKAANAARSVGFVAVAAVVLAGVLLVLGLLGVTGVVVTTLALFFSIFTAFYLLAVVVFGLPAQFAELACDSDRFGITRRFVRESLNINDITADATNATQHVELDFMRYMCGNRSLDTLCATSRYGCNESLCASLSAATVDSVIAALNDTLSAVGNSSFSIRGCATAPTGECSDAAAATGVMAAYAAFNISMTAFSPLQSTSLAALLSAAPLDTMLSTLCSGDNSIRHDLKNPAGFSAFAAFCGFFWLVVGVLGAKRFRANQAGDGVVPFPEAITQPQEMHVVPVYGIPVDGPGREEPTHHVVIDDHHAVIHHPNAVATKAAPF